MQLSRRAAGVSGVVFVPLSLAIAVTAPPPPGLAASGAEIVSYYSAHQVGFLIGNYLGAVAILPAFFLIVYLTIAIRDAEPGRGRIWVFSAATNAGALTMALVLFALLQAAAVVAPGNAPATAKAVSDAANMVFGFVLLPTGTGIAALSWGFLATRTFGRPVALVGMVVAAVQVIASLGTIVVTGPL